MILTKEKFIGPPDSSHQETLGIVSVTYCIDCVRSG